MEKIFASIITIGDELLIGQVIDTNSAWIAQELNKKGVTVKRRVAVGDRWDDIWNALDEESKHAEIILITGGLGPTSDDITKPLLCEYFGGKMIMHEPTLAHLKYLFENVLKRPMIERNRKQAELPDNCIALKNEVGTAPGMLFTRSIPGEKEKIFVSLPGVPYEMKWIMEHHVLPLIAQKFTTGVIEHRTLLTASIGESYLADMIKDFENELPAHIKLAYLPDHGMVRLRLTSNGDDKDSIHEELDHQFQALKSLVAAYLVVDEDIPMQAVIGRLLKEKHQTVSTAESCTGGYIAHLLTSIPGSSTYYMGSVVSYDYRIKREVLHVKEDTLLSFGAVSEETVREMAQNILEIMNTDYAIAVSGIMGPEGGMPGKPVGQVWVAVASKNKMITQKFNFRFDRSRNIHLTATNALNLLRSFILENS